MKTRYLFPILVIFLLVFVQVVSAGEIKPDLSEILEKAHKAEKVPVIVIFHEKPTPADISIIKSDGASIKYQYTLIDAVAIKVPVQAADKIAKRPFVKLVEPDYKVKLVLDKSIPQVQADKVWGMNVTGNGIDVAVIDTGIHDEHPSLTVETEVDYTGEGTDDLQGHGTHVAGIIASTGSTYRGVAYGADLFNVKVLNRFGFGSGSDVIKGIEWAVDNGAEVISMSLGAEIETCDGTDAISQAVDKAVSRGVVVVIAAGNSGPDSRTITSPGCSKKGITVGAVDDKETIPSFSSRGPTADGRVKPDLVAPGVAITSTWNDNSFNSLSGTSMSTPHVSGIAALLLETDSTLSPSDVLEVLRLTALDLGLDENTQGAGRVDAYEAYIVIANITKEPEDGIKAPENKTEEDKDELNKTKKTPPGLEKRKKTGLPPAFERGLPPAGLTPNSFFYGFKKFFEGVDLLFTFDNIKKAEKYVKYAELRLSEANEMINMGKAENVEGLIKEYEEKIEKSNKIVEIAKDLGKDTAKIERLVEEAASKHLEILAEVYEKVPEQAKSAIEKAMNISVKIRKKTVEALKEKNALEDIPEEKSEEEEIEIKVPEEEKEVKIQKKPSISNPITSDKKEEPKKISVEGSGSKNRISGAVTGSSASAGGSSGGAGSGKGSSAGRR